MNTARKLIRIVGLPHFSTIDAILLKKSQLCPQYVSSRLCTQSVPQTKSMMAPVLYHSVMSVLDVLQNEKFKEHKGVVKILDTYSTYLHKASTGKGPKNYPLIVVEGLDGCGKSTITRLLAEKIGAKLCRTPPDEVCKDIRNLFDDDKLLRTTYYALGNYIAALEMSLILQDQPIILDRFWHSTAAYAIAQAALDYPTEFNLPEKDDEIYKWPEDLLKPDIVVLLSVSEHVRMERQSRRTATTWQESLLNNNHKFRENVLNAYRNMAEPDVVFVDGEPKTDEVVQNLFYKIKYLL